MARTGRPKVYGPPQLIKFTDEQHALLRAYAKGRGCTISDAVREFVDRGLSLERPLGAKDKRPNGPE